MRMITSSSSYTIYESVKIRHVASEGRATANDYTQATATGSVTVETGAIKLKISDRISPSHLYDVILGRDWFKLCSTGLEDNPEAALQCACLL